MKISAINIFPVKSMSGISLKEAKVEKEGFKFDRRWLLTDEKNQFLTQREYPQMASFEIEISGDALNFKYKNEQKSIAIKPQTGKTANVTVWRSKLKAEVYDDETNEWFSDILGTKCRLAAMTEISKRIVNPIYAVKKYSDTVSFADGYPFMILAESSLADLNEKLEKALPMNRFRPNLVVADAEAFAEDGWKKIKIGETVFHVVKPCDRCVVTTIDQEKGIKDGKEPLKTLAEYRQRGDKILFGQYLIPENSGEKISLGDQVEILETKSKKH